LEDNTATLQLLLRAITYNINILRNGGRPPIELQLPEDSTEADADSVSAWFEKNYMGPHNAGKTLVSFKGSKANVLGITPQEMAYLELLRYGLRQVAGQYGVPLLLVGFPEGTNRATASEARRSFYLTNIFPLRKLISQKITREIIQDSMKIEGWRLDFKTAGLEESESSRRDFMLARSQALYSFNEARIAMGLLPIDEPWANKYFLLSSKNDALIPIEEAMKRLPENSAPESERNKPDRGKGEENPAEDESSHDEG
jgi:HK97 family phage portal protein